MSLSGCADAVENTRRRSPPLLVRRAARLITCIVWRKEIELLAHLGKGRYERSSASLRDTSRECTGEPVRFLSSEAAHSFKPRSLAMILLSSTAAGRAMRGGNLTFRRLGMCVQEQAAGFVPASENSREVVMPRELYDASTRSIFSFASATAPSFRGAKVRSADRATSGKSVLVGWMLAHQLAHWRLRTI